MKTRGPGNERIWAVADRTKASPQRSFAKQMRKEPTNAEKKLWRYLRQLPVEGVHFRRQVQIGPYIADFVSHTAKLVIEIDGGQHALQEHADALRSQRIEADGYRVLRFWNNDVLANTEGVLAVILDVISSTPTPDPSPQGGGEKQLAKR